MSGGRWAGFSFKWGAQIGFIKRVILQQGLAAGERSVMQILGGRTFQAKAISSAKILRQKHAWCA